MNDENEKLKKDDEDYDDNVIIIKGKEQIYTFEKNTYKEDLLSDIYDKNRVQLTRQVYDEIIEKAAKTMGNSWSNKRANDQIKISGEVIFLSILAVVLTIAYMVTMYTSTTAKNGTALFVISIICISFASAIVIFLSIYNFCRKITKFRSLDVMIKEDMDKYFSELNIDYSGKLEFKYNSEKMQIELTALNKPKKKINDNQNIEMQKIDN